jgi:methylglutaconyl-CoA hydratase
VTGQTIIVTRDSRGIATITLNRAEQHNAFDDVMIAELNQALDTINEDEKVRLLILRAAGKSFSAGADLNWMRRMADYSYQQNHDDAMQLARLMKTLNGLCKPVIGLIQGASFGGGVGLVACCDIAIASDRAKFCLSEVRLGLIPAVISPYVIAAMGERACRRYFTTAERFDANEACRLGLVHQVVAGENLESALQKIIDEILLGGPAAQAAAKDLVLNVTRRRIDTDLIEDTADRIARIRASEEGREGLNAFIQKRQPDWDKL